MPPLLDADRTRRSVKILTPSSRNGRATVSAAAGSSRSRMPERLSHFYCNGTAADDGEAGRQCVDVRIDSEFTVGMPGSKPAGRLPVAMTKRRAVKVCGVVPSSASVWESRNRARPRTGSTP